MVAKSLMKNSTFKTGSTDVLLSGTQALVTACLIQKKRDIKLGLNTAGYVTGYRGSPLGAVDQEFAKAKSELNESEVLFQEALNEDLAATALWGTQQCNLHSEGSHKGIFGLWYGKGPGVDRSGDALRHANLAGTSSMGGVVMAMGDDHTGESSTTLHQSDYGLVDAMIPIFSPSGVQEIIDYSILGWTMSRYAGVWTGLKCVKDTVEIKEIVDTRPERLPFSDFFDQNPSGYLGIRLGDTPFKQEERLHGQKLPAVKRFVKENRIDKGFFYQKKARIGILSAGKNWLDLLSALDLLGLKPEECERLGITCYKVGVVWPLEESNLRNWAQSLDLIVVIEEKRKLLEGQVKSILFNDANHAKVIGEYDESGKMLFQSSFALNPLQIAKVLAEQVKKITNSKIIDEKLAKLMNSNESLKNANYDPRQPYFCAGCPHNSSTLIPEGSRAYAGIGCHYMVQWMDRSTVGYTHMGGEGANWIGEAAFSTRKHIFQNVGDGTYNHSGLMAIRAAVASEVNITYKILFNDAVAMTGGQKNDGKLDPLRIIEELKAFGVKEVVGVYDPKESLDLASYRKLVEIKPRDQLLDVQKRLEKTEGVTAIVYIQTCAAEKRRRRKKGLYPDIKERLFINPEVCEGCGDCGIQSNCVAILPLNTNLGRKRSIDQSSCNKDFSCVNGFCPSFVTVEGGVLRTEPSGHLNLNTLPQPDKAKISENPYNMVITGIGGSGIVTIGTLLALAAKEENKYVGIMEMAGLAQKGGEVHVHCKIAKNKEDISAVRVAEGQADAIIGGDLLVTASEKALILAKGTRTKVVCNINELVTGDFTRNPDTSLKTDSMQLSIRSHAKKDFVWFIDSTKFAKSYLGDSIFSNIVLLGFAFQAGLVPLHSSSLEAAFKKHSSSFDANIRAFNIGRHICQNGIIELGEEKRQEDLNCNGSFPNESEYKFRKQRLTDYGGKKLLQKYEEKVSVAFDLDEKLGSAVAKSYFNLLYRKDEYEVARLHLNYLKNSLNSTFSSYKALRFHLAPPILSLRSKNGRPRKYIFGEWVLVIFKILTLLRPLRDSNFDLLGMSKERRIEKRLIKDYEKDLTFIFKNFNSKNRSILIDLAMYPNSIKGFGPVKQKMIKNATQNRLDLLLKYQKNEKMPLNELLESKAI